MSSWYDEYEKEAQTNQANESTGAAGQVNWLAPPTPREEKPAKGEGREGLLVAIGNYIIEHPNVIYLAFLPVLVLVLTIGAFFGVLLGPVAAIVVTVIGLIVVAALFFVARRGMFGGAPAVAALPLPLFPLPQFLSYFPPVHQVLLAGYSSNMIRMIDFLSTLVLFAIVTALLASVLVLYLGYTLSSLFAATTAGRGMNIFAQMETIGATVLMISLFGLAFYQVEIHPDVTAVKNAIRSGGVLSLSSAGPILRFLSALHP